MLFMLFMQQPKGANTARTSAFNNLRRTDLTYMPRVLGDSEPLPAAAVPTVFVPGPAKSGTTFLFSCLADTFSPAQTCPTQSASPRRGRLRAAAAAATWSDEACGNASGFLLTARVTSSGGQTRTSCLSPQKENCVPAGVGLKPRQVGLRPAT